MKRLGGWLLLCCALAAASASALVLSPEPDLALELSDEGRVTGLALQQRPRPVLGLGGFEVADLARGADQAQWCPIPASLPADLGHGGQPVVASLLTPEEGRTPVPRWLFGGRWSLAAEGNAFSDAEGEAHSSAVAQLSAGPGGSLLRLVCPVADAVRQTASFTVRARLRGAPPGRAGVLALAASGRPLTAWVPCWPETRRGDWTDWTARVFAPPNTAGLMLIVAGEESQADIACAGAWLTAHLSGGAEPVDGRLTATADGALFSGEAQGLRLTAEYRLVGGAVRISGRLSSTVSRPRAVCVTYRLPLDGAGWRWWHDPARSEPITASSLRTLCSWQHLGDGHLYSPWPLGSISRDVPAGAVTLAQPTAQPLLTRFGFRQEDGLFASLDLGLDPAHGHDTAAFELAVYASEPRWGLRGALERHAAVFPTAPAPPAPQGAWFAGIDPGAVTDPRRWALRYDERAGEHAEWAARNGIVPLSRWQPWAKPAPDDASPARRDPAGRAWSPTTTDTAAALGELDKLGRSVVIDGLATSWAGWDLDDTDPSHWATCELPLSASRARRRPAMPAAVRHLDLLAAAAERLHGAGRLALGGPDPTMPLPWVLPYLDVLSGGLRAPDYTHLLWLRSLAPGKPITYLEPRLLSPATLPGLLDGMWSDALMVGAYPGPVGLLMPDLAQANASWFARHLPLLGPLTASGWQPVPHAACNDELVQIQRFGQGDTLALVVRSRSTRDRAVRLTLWPAALSLSRTDGQPLPELYDLLAPSVPAVPLTVDFDRWQASLTLPAGRTMVLRLRPAG